MTEEEARRLQLDILVANLGELLNQGFGEIEYRLVVKNNQIEYISLTKTNTFKIKDGKI